MNKRKYWGIIFYNTVFSRETLRKQQVLERIQKTKLFCGLGLGHRNMVFSFVIVTRGFLSRPDYFSLFVS
jgi:hypothetical protein